MFDADTFVAKCRDALRDPEPRRAMRDTLREALDRPGDVATKLARPVGGLELLFSSPTLTVLNVIWAPCMTIYPHDHRMWALIGIYGGGEDNTLFRRGPNGLTSSGGKALREGDVFSLGAEAIHSVENPLRRFTGAIHVYGGDFVNQARSQWDPDTFEEQPYDPEQVRSVFADANAAWAAAGSPDGSS